MKKHQKLDLVKKFQPSETIGRQNIASKIESLSDRRGRKIKKKKTKMPILGRCKNVRFSEWTSWINPRIFDQWGVAITKTQI